MSEKKRMSERVRRREWVSEWEERERGPSTRSTLVANSHTDIYIDPCTYRCRHIKIESEEKTSEQRERKTTIRSPLVADVHTYIYRYTWRYRYIQIESEEKTSEQRKRKTAIRSPLVADIHTATSAFVSVYICAFCDHDTITCTNVYRHKCTCCRYTVNPTWGDIFESSKLKARTSLLPRFSEKTRSSFELWNIIRKCHPKWDWLYIHISIDIHVDIDIYRSSRKKRLSEQRERKTTGIHMEIDIYRSSGKKRRVSREKKRLSIRSNDQPLLPIHIHIYIYIYLYTYRSYIYIYIYLSIHI